jgi:hypothetical protein
MDIIKMFFDDKYNFVVQISIWLILALAFITIIYFFYLKNKLRYHLVKVDIKLGNVGVAEFRPNKHDLQIAHKIWTE